MKRSLESAGLYTIDPLHGSLPSPARARSPGYEALVTIVGLGRNRRISGRGSSSAVQRAFRLAGPAHASGSRRSRRAQRAAASLQQAGSRPAQGASGWRALEGGGQPSIRSAWCAWTKRLAGLLLRSRQVVLMVGSAASKQKEQGAGIRARAIVANHRTTAPRQRSTMSTTTRRTGRCC